MGLAVALGLPLPACERPAPIELDVDDAPTLGSEVGPREGLNAAQCHTL